MSSMIGRFLPAEHPPGDPGPGPSQEELDRIGRAAWDHVVAFVLDTTGAVQAERERIIRLAEAGDVMVYIDEDGDGISVAVPFAEIIRRSS